MPKSKPVTFSRQTIPFLIKASRQRHPKWLDRNREEYERLIQKPWVNLATQLKVALAPVAAGYHFPIQGIGRLKRPAHRVADGGGLYRSWLSYSASIPTGSRFDHNPNLYFMIDADDSDDPVLVAGGLYVPSSRQLRAIREAIAEDASAFDELFADREFSRAFKGGFSPDRKSTRPPRGFDPNHPRMDWLKLQAYFVWKPYTIKEFISPNFPKILEKDWRQILRLNQLLNAAIQGRLPRGAVVRSQGLRREISIEDRIGDVTPRVMDF